MRAKIYDIIKPNATDTMLSRIYDIVMIFTITVSLIPLCFKHNYTIFGVIENLVAVVFIADYILRWVTADLYFGKKGAGSFLRYPFTLMAIIDLLTILPSLMILNSGFRVLRTFRLLRSLRVLRVFRVFRYSKNVDLLLRVLERQKDNLLTVLGFALGYIFLSAVAIFQVEPETFHTFFDALYWATVSLTTVGYGDIYAVSTVGRVITMLSSFIGLAVVALPAGLFTAGYLEVLNDVPIRGVEEENETDDELR